jgi:hypothetical protein
MNRTYGDGKNGKFVMCILEPANLHKLVEERKPIEFSLNEATGPYERGLPAKLSVIIAYSETPIADSRELEKMLVPGGKVSDQRTPVSQAKRPHCPECHSTIEQLGVWRNESPMALAFYGVCGCVFGMVPTEVVKGLKP